jgi:hypothetical protein
MTNAPRFPARRFYGEAMQSSLAILKSSQPRYDQDLDAQGWTGRRVLGFKLPEWQRQAVWSDAQSARFLESVWRGANIGAYMLNHSMTRDDVHNVLIDGQQRLRALARYWNGEIAVLGDDGNFYLWTDLVEREHAHFLRISFPWISTAYDSDAIMREAYDRHNFGGIAHAENERAVSLGSPSTAF